MSMGDMLGNCTKCGDPSMSLEEGLCPKCWNEKVKDEPYYMDKVKKESPALKEARFNAILDALKELSDQGHEPSRQLLREHERLKRERDGTVEIQDG